MKRILPRRGTPQYGGESFEKQVDSWMRNHNFLRLTYKHGSYIHKDFPESKYKKKINIALGKYDKQLSFLSLDFQHTTIRRSQTFAEST